MTGWLIFAAFALVILGLLAWPVRLGRAGLMLVAAALFTAAAGYAWQGSPGLAGVPAAERDRPMGRDTLFATERLRFLDHYGETGIVLATADAFHRSGQDEAAVGLLHNSTIQHPGDVALRIGYAHALFLLAQGNFTPAVGLAFDRADQIAKPADPAPGYFRGLVLIESGDTAGAERYWRAVYARLPQGSPWVRPLGQQLAMFDMMHAAEAQRRAGMVAPAP
jgi:hypothetical protein